MRLHLLLHLHHHLLLILELRLLRRLPKAAHVLKSRVLASLWQLSRVVVVHVQNVVDRALLLHLLRLLHLLSLYLLGLHLSLQLLGLNLLGLNLGATWLREGEC